ncbi:hypothetical protein DC498_11050 [Terrimonas sp.]|uniref:hypothetical protein n=1 Tax=Terrimonas sp. TaxID=1914338 RepID=UPI000D5203C4|nr:hypothetical protein [Terrimonas sp.]PVD52253.1 hypothetical protein DC498_11050 [Terrimonas sp.]
MIENIKFKIINATSELPKDIVVINASVKSDNPKTFYYDQDISIVPFVSNNTFLKSGNVDEIIIPDVKRDDKGNSLPYTFIIAEAQTLAPIKSVTFKADLSDLAEFTINDLTINKIDVVFDFNKNITALPTSELASEFAVLDYTNDEATKEYFAKTKNYKEVTLDDWYLIRSYYNALPYGWANGEDLYIYLYDGSFKDNLDTDIAKAIGTIKITNNWSLPLPLDKSDEFKVEIQLHDGIVKKMFFDNGVFYDTEEIETARVRLAGSFIIPDQITTEHKKNEIVTFLPGTINSIQAFGIAGDAPKEGRQNDGGFLGLFDTQTVEQVGILGMCFIGIGIGIGILVRLGQFINWYKKYGNPAISQQERYAQTEALKQYIKEQMVQLTSNIHESVKVPMQSEIPVAQQVFKTYQLELKTYQAKNNIRQMADAQSYALELITDKYVSKDLEIASDNLIRVGEKIACGDVSDFEGWVSESLSILDHNVATITAAYVFIASELYASEVKAYKKFMKTCDDARIILEKNQKEVKDINSGADEREIIEEE